MCNEKSLFTHYRTTTRKISVCVGNGMETEVKGIGEIRAIAKFDEEERSIQMKDALYIPHLMCNLISVSRLRKSGYKITFDTDVEGHGVCVITRKSLKGALFKAYECADGLYELDMVPEDRNAHNALASRGTHVQRQNLWHARLGHASETVINKTIPLVNGIDLKKCKDLSPCKCCLEGKSKRDSRIPASEESKQATKPLDLGHADVVGPTRHPSLGGARFFIPLIDDAGGISLVRFLKRKSESSQAIKSMVTELETVFNVRVKHLTVSIKRLRTDNAKEFLSHDFLQWLQERGIRHETTSSYSPESNGKAERLNRTLMDMARTMLREVPNVKRHACLWAEAVHTANYLRNRMYTTSCKDRDKTPYEVILGKKPDVSHLRRFGAKAFVHVPKPKRKGKFAPRAQEGILVGYDCGNSYKVYFPETGTVVTSRDVTFDETVDVSQRTEVPKDRQKSVQQSMLDEIDLPDLVDLDDEEVYVDQGCEELEDESDGDGGDCASPDKDILQKDHASDDDAQLEAANDDMEPPANPEHLTHYPQTTKSGRIVRPVARFGGTATIISADTEIIALNVRLGNEEATVPTTYKEALQSPHAGEWKTAMQKEFNEISKDTWILVPPPSQKPIKNKWVYATKTDADNNINRRKARLVAKGFSQREGIDFNETFAPVAKYQTLRFMLSLAADEHMELLQLDVKSAFLNGKLNEDIYTEQPEGFVDPKRPHWVYKLLRSLYGLKQASRAWYHEIDSFLKSIRFMQSTSDCNLYHRKVEKDTIFILVYVDDMLLLGKRQEHLQLYAQKITTKYESRIESDITKFLGIVIDRNKQLGIIKVSSGYMIDQMLEKFGMTKCKEANVPILQGMGMDYPDKMARGEGEFVPMQYVPYKHLVGALLHLANTTRPDIAFAASFLSRFMQNPRKVHWNAAKHVLKYLKKTRNLGIIFRQSDEKGFRLIGYTDKCQRQRLKHEGECWPTVQDVLILNLWLTSRLLVLLVD